MRYILIIITLLFSLPGFAQDFPEPMQPQRIVNDFTGMFSQQQTNALEQKLRLFNDTSSTQIAVVTVPTLQGYDPNDYAQRLAEKWGIGQKGKDNGILILVQPKTQRERGQVAIAVGYGLEGVVPDAVASRIIRNEIIPEFQRGDYYAGVNKATDILIKLSAGEFTADKYVGEGNGQMWALLPFFIAFVLFLLVRKRKGYTTTGNHSGGVPPFFIGGLGGSGSRGFGSFSSGSGSFGGFGGGGFGGGGASGSW